MSSSGTAAATFIVVLSEAHLRHLLRAYASY
jgi:hypothetical protein